jgi:hypothetical protein
VVFSDCSPAALLCTGTSTTSYELGETFQISHSRLMLG